MSEHDPAFTRALAAYAAATSGERIDAQRLRTRILRGARAPVARRSRRLLSTLLPLAAAFAASAALAATQPIVRSAISRQLNEWLGAPAEPKTQPLDSRIRGARPISHPAAPPARGIEPSSASKPDVTPPLAVDDLPLAAPFVEGRGTGRSPARISPTSPDSAEIQAYRAAHRTHFDAGDADAALAAWDRYLAEFPAGSFADDARFNRALCLIRLGDLPAARNVLTRFADAAPGSYRRNEAAALIRALDGREPADSRPAQGAEK